MESTGLTKIAKKILAIMADVSHIEKDGWNAFQKYNYVSEAGAAHAVRKSMIAHKVMCFPNVLELRETPVPGEKAKYLTSIMVEYTWIDAESGESITFTMPGQGVDSGDKGVYKALTGANKYALLKLLQIPTGDDPEDEKKPRGKSKAKAEPKADSDIPPSDKQINFIKKLLGQKDFDDNTLELYEKATEWMAMAEGGDYWKSETAKKLINRLMALPDKE